MNTLTVGCLLGCLMFAAAPQGADDAGPARRVQRALDEPADVIFDDKSFDEAMSFFKNRLKVEIEVDAGTYRPDGFTMVSSRNATLREALRAYLGQFSLYYAVVGGRIVVGSEQTVVQRQLRQIISIDADQSHLVEIIQRIVDGHGASIVLDPRAEPRRVTLKLAEVPLESGVRLAAELAGLCTVRLSNVLFVTTPESAARLRPDADGPVPPIHSLNHGVAIEGGGGMGVFPGPMPAVPPFPGRPRR